ncbi:hypothetical protein CRYUN_Cryun25bG0032300 [Craigia yunnanensis]
MSNCNSYKLHIAMFPWFAFSHLILFLHHSNKLPEKGQKMVPKLHLMFLNHSIDPELLALIKPKIKLKPSYRL